MIDIVTEISVYVCVYMCKFLSINTFTRREKEREMYVICNNDYLFNS